MKIYLVGGAVRDQLLGLEVKDKDYVVVGATPEAMLAQGFRQVGKDFPVFLHPQTQAEYALARTERKQGQGYKGFVVHASPDVTLEEDLIRRDLTINAIALDETTGERIDPYGGEQDLQHKVLRHVSAAFAEDPLRVLRVARFAARLSHLGFTVASETLSLMQTMVASGELSALTAERVWQEISLALQSPQPQVFVQVLREVGALKQLLPEIDQLFGVPQPEQWHPEIDTGVHVLLCLEQAVRLGADLETRFAVLCHDVGKGLTPPEKWPKHHGHGALGVPAIKALCQRLSVPNVCRDLAFLVSEFHTTIHDIQSLKHTTVIKLLNQMDAWRRPDRFKQILLACRADSQGRPGFEDTPYPQAELLWSWFEAMNQISPKQFVDAGYQNQAIGEALRQARLKLLKTLRTQEV